MSHSEQPGGRPRSKRRGRRRPRATPKPQVSTPGDQDDGGVSGDAPKSQTGESPAKKVFIYTYTVYKGG